MRRLVDLRGLASRRLYDYEISTREVKRQAIENDRCSSKRRTKRQRCDIVRDPELNSICRVPRIAESSRDISAWTISEVTIKLCSHFSVALTFYNTGCISGRVIFVASAFTESVIAS